MIGSLIGGIVPVICLMVCYPNLELNANDWQGTSYFWKRLLSFPLERRSRLICNCREKPLRRHRKYT